MNAVFFFFNDTATTEIYTLSLHDALPIFHAIQNRCPHEGGALSGGTLDGGDVICPLHGYRLDRKSTRLNSSHSQISYAVFCLKKKTCYVQDNVRRTRYLQLGYLLRIDDST